MTDWELSKENVMPLKHGRQVEILNASVNPDEGAIKREQQYFEEQIRLESDDPLEPWHRYIKWTEQHYPKGGREGTLHTLLHRCLDKFRDVTRYNNDSRYLDVWLRVANFVDDPLTVFQHLWDQNVCCELAEFYCSWAEVLEDAGNFPAANDVFKKGIEGQATPIQLLHRRHTEFESRVARRTMSELQAGRSVMSSVQRSSTASTSQHEEQRRPMQALKPRSSGRSAPVERASNYRSSSARLLLQPTSNSGQNPSAPSFPVFNDENAPPDTALPVLSTQAGEFNTAPSQLNNRRENKMEASVWTENKLPRSRPYGSTSSLPTQSSDSSLPFHVHEDPPAEQETYTTNDSVFRQHQPLSTIKKSKTESAADLFRSQSHGGDEKSRLGFDKDALYTGNAEYQFEEVKALRWRKKHKKSPPDMETELRSNLRSEMEAQIREEIKKEMEEVFNRERAAMQHEMDEVKTCNQMMKDRIEEMEKHVKTGETYNEMMKDRIEQMEKHFRSEIQQAIEQAMDMQRKKKLHEARPPINRSRLAVAGRSGSHSYDQGSGSLLQRSNSFGQQDVSDSSHSQSSNKTAIEPIPTVNTKQATETVEAMFNRTLGAVFGRSTAFDSGESPSIPSTGDAVGASAKPTKQPAFAVFSDSSAALPTTAATSAPGPTTQTQGFMIYTDSNQENSGTSLPVESRHRPTGNEPASAVLSASAAVLKERSVTPDSVAAACGPSQNDAENLPPKAPQKRRALSVLSSDAPDLPVIPPPTLTNPSNGATSHSRPPNSAPPTVSNFKQASNSNGPQQNKRVSIDPQPLCGNVIEPECLPDLDLSMIPPTELDFQQSAKLASTPFTERPTDPMQLQEQQRIRQQTRSRIVSTARDRGSLQCAMVPPLPREQHGYLAPAPKKRVSIVSGNFVQKPGDDIPDHDLAAIHLATEQEFQAAAVLASTPFVEKPLDPLQKQELKAAQQATRQRIALAPVDRGSLPFAMAPPLKHIDPTSDNPTDDPVIQSGEVDSNEPVVPFIAVSTVANGGGYAPSVDKTAPNDPLSSVSQNSARTPFISQHGRTSTELSPIVEGSNEEYKSSSSEESRSRHGSQHSTKSLSQSMPTSCKKKQDGLSTLPSSQPSSSDTSPLCADASSIVPIPAPKQVVRSENSLQENTVFRESKDKVSPEFAAQGSKLKKSDSSLSASSKKSSPSDPTSTLSSAHKKITGLSVRPVQDSSKCEKRLEKSEHPQIDTSDYEPAEDNAVTHALEQSIFIDPSDPFDDRTIDTFLSALRTPISKYPSFVSLPNVTLPRKPRLPQNIIIGTDSYMIERLLGEGAYAKVYAGKRTKDNHLVALKVQLTSGPANMWEFYIGAEVFERLKPIDHVDVSESFMRIDRAYFCSNATCFVNEFHPAGTLLHLVNFMRATGFSHTHQMLECLVALITIEMLYILEALHSCNIIHADIKPDNFLLVDLPELQTGETMAEVLGNSTRTVKLIDFGRSIDMLKFPENTTFAVNGNASGFECIEMKTNRPWTFQTDYFGFLGTVHVLAFGRYMKARFLSRENRWTHTSHFQRFWHVEFWDRLFNTLMNVPSCDELPSLRDLRLELEEIFIKDLLHKYIRSYKHMRAALSRLLEKS